MTDRCGQMQTQGEDKNNMLPYLRLRGHKKQMSDLDEFLVALAALVGHTGQVRVALLTVLAHHPRVVELVLSAHRKDHLNQSCKMFVSTYPDNRKKIINIDKRIFQTNKNSQCKTVPLVYDINNMNKINQWGPSRNPALNLTWIQVSCVWGKHANHYANRTSKDFVS